MLGISENPYCSKTSFCALSQTAVLTITVLAVGIIVFLHLSHPSLFFGHGGCFLYAVPLSFLLFAETAVAAVVFSSRPSEKAVEEVEKSASLAAAESANFTSQTIEKSGQTVANLDCTEDFVVWTKTEEERTSIYIHNHEKSPDAVEEIVLKKGMGTFLLDANEVLITDSSGQTLKIYDLQNRKRLLELRCEEEKIIAAALFGRVLIYGTDQGKIAIWDRSEPPTESFSFRIQDEKIVSLHEFGNFLLVVSERSLAVPQKSRRESYALRYFPINAFFRNKADAQLIGTFVQEPKLLMDGAYLFLFDKSKRRNQLTIFEHHEERIVLDRLCTLGKISAEEGRAFKTSENEDIDFKIYDGRLYIHYLQKNAIRTLEGEDQAAKYFYRLPGLSCFCIFKGILLYGTNEGEVYFYHRESGRKINEFQAHKGAIQQILVSGDHLVTRTEHTIKYWHLN